MANCYILLVDAVSVSMVLLSAASVLKAVAKVIDSLKK